jgi:hypothetical protein
MIRNVEVHIAHGAVDEAPKIFEIKFFIKFKKNPVTLWLSSDMTQNDFLRSLVSFLNVLILIGEE